MSTDVPLDIACNKTIYLSKVCLKDTLILFLYWSENLEHNLAANELCSVCDWGSCQNEAINHYISTQKSLKLLESEHLISGKFYKCHSRCEPMKRQVMIQ